MISTGITKNYLPNSYIYSSLICDMRVKAGSVYHMVSGSIVDVLG